MLYPYAASCRHLERPYIGNSWRRSKKAGRSSATTCGLVPVPYNCRIIVVHPSKCSQIDQRRPKASNDVWISIKSWQFIFSELPELLPSPSRVEGPLLERKPPTIQLINGLSAPAICRRVKLDIRILTSISQSRASSQQFLFPLSLSAYSPFGEGRFAWGLVGASKLLPSTKYSTRTDCI